MVIGMAARSLNWKKRSIMYQNPSDMKEKSFQDLAEEVRELRKSNQELESLLIESKRALDAGRDMNSLYEVAQDLIELKKAQEELKKERDYLKNVLDNSADAIGIVDAKGRFRRWNKRAEELFGYHFQELKGKSAFDLYADKSELERLLAGLRKKRYVRNFEVNIRRKDGQIIPFDMSIRVLQEQGVVIGSVCVARELSQIKQVQAALKKSNEDLEKRVRERTAELSDANRKLEEANIALRVLLEQKDENKAAYEQNLVFNIQQLIQPCLEKLHGSGLDENQEFYLRLIQSQINEVISPLKRDLSDKYGLTQTEVALVELIKQGQQTKEIAEHLSLSHRTIDTHRHNIRKKLGLLNKGINLRSHLLTLDRRGESGNWEEAMRGER